MASCLPHRRSAARTRLLESLWTGDAAAVRAQLEALGDRPRQRVLREPMPLDVSETALPPLWVACTGGSRSVVQVLLEHGVAVDWRHPVSGDTALHSVLRRRDRHHLAVDLVRAGASLEARNAAGQTPIEAGDVPAALQRRLQAAADHHHEVQTFCTNPVCTAPAMRVAGSRVDCPSCKRPLLLRGRYRAQRMLGQGAQGRTLLVVDEDKPSRPVCVAKQSFVANDRSARAVEQFDNEAVQLEALSRKCKRIPALLAHFDHNGARFIVMDYIEGLDLRAVVEQSGAMGQTDTEEILSAVLAILRAVHQEGVIHRDVKPENIIQSAQGGVFLVDFGISLDVSTEEVSAELWRRSRAFRPTGSGGAGTPGFTSPEQMAGKPCFASDLYGLGVTCIYLLTATHPTKMVDLHKDWTSLLATPVADSLVAILDRMIAPLPARYRTAEEAILDLQRHLFDRSATAPATSFSNRHKSAPVGGAVTAMIAATSQAELAAVGGPTADEFEGYGPREVQGWLGEIGLGIWTAASQELVAKHGVTGHELLRGSESKILQAFGPEAGAVVCRARDRLRG